MNVYRFELRCLGKSILGWCLGLCLLTSVYLSLYPMFHDLNFDAGALFSKFPENLQALFGMTGMDTNRFLGYLPFPIKLAEELVAIGGLTVGAFAAAHDHRCKCADFLFAKPVSRGKVFAAKLGAVATMGAALFLVFAAFLLAAGRLMAPAEPFPLSAALALSAIPALMFGLYAAAGLLLGVAVPQVRGVAAIGVGAMFFFHLVFSVGKVLTKNPDHPLVRATTPVCMFDRGLAAAQGRLEWPYVLLWCVEVGVLLAACVLVLRRRDVR